MTMIVGHRGARNLWPENSLSGFRKTAALGIEAVEFDIHLTRSGEIAVLHDASLDRTTYSSGDVADLTPETRRRTMLRESLEEHIPVLEEVLDIFKPTAMELHVELKNTSCGDIYAGLAERAIGAIRSAGMEDRCILTGFTPEVLEEVRSLAPDIRRLASMNLQSAVVLGGLLAAVRRLAAIADIVAIEKSLLGAAWERVTKELPLERVCPWVANTEPDLRHWLAKGVRQVTTDRPDLALEIRGLSGFETVPVPTIRKPAA
ncbi:glycerophosphodiester phosphodiesterase family protein [Sinorhizobium sp. BG8]|uniref:glycerophosphodiester phosphodiesterase family protein n=1 Tax=Sinorhizobium sp. BG8 TaxID=2613773 RepID=UPI00193D4E25|nr:glycerophosphodiester phosphodiesterase family protein [Sinorhizobium sp. BG8]QRM55837.1 glycerophosphodiester phosphodiesterase [Sinorhizobium sp. BG8]